MPKTARMLRLFLGSAITLAVLSSGGSLALALNAADVFGVWQHPENGSQIELYPCGDSLCARISRNSDGQTTDDKNPDAGLRARAIVGLVIMSDARKTGSLAWAGSLYNRADGRTYAGQITLKQQDTLVMTGCTAIVICRSVTWTRAAPAK